ncbi:oxidoreductase (plasmid) [Cryobacterium sp. LW097]|uniref:SDR family NAD(P)-dependent oxidoreductase n=1 Tax=unclassified Cryobacterium TaxID=2649013 RepID=UPI000B4D345F|nr:MULTISPECIES: SDR family NAD(P)-dependent oxidoreductase [unclassified Cryobacterium]ASD24255.1 oxidoreductase [Cryobacterium sp. LW097]TFC52871.1 SDR family NAD(P)-dependent oxidoreductase [Cryobacterium sp. TMB3-1-2]TFC62246.1 SDR family NAD(P)-dependent oxidoreductase [Cryobacterium sp. TMB1-7]TFC70721.1 SDR family NAD(P)-dependent oxidoreductase [Cryobacterium sp. TMB3-15]TFC75480.1 SDR family NAD(P)-dependent oxidoreductase [Cryobacterium sp. TMB3-10]
MELSEDASRLAGKRVVVTGGSSGLGEVVAATLSRGGAHVTLAVRDLQRGQAAAAKTPGRVDVATLELGSLSFIKQFADSRTEPIDVLINNAGIMMPPLGRTEDGFETQFGVNYLGHFALTMRLLPLIRDRVVTVTSDYYRSGSIDLDDPNYDRRRFNSGKAYSQSKLADLMFARELGRRLTGTGSRVRSLSAHPGYARTSLTSHVGSVAFRVIDKVLGPVIAQDAAGGARSLIAAAVSDLPSGTLVGPGGLFHLKGNPVVAPVAKVALDEHMARKLWMLSAEMTRVPINAPLAAS